MTIDSSRGGLNTRSVGQVAYLTNQYPSPSHSFIRREIVALEAAGWRVHRFAHRGSHVALVDPADARELDRTCVLLDLPLRTLSFAVLMWLVQRPLDTVAAMALAVCMAWHGDRRYVAHAAYFVMACALSRRLRALGCSHVHAHFGTNPAAVVRLANRVCGLRYSVTFHGPHEFEPNKKLNLREKIKAASFIAAVSNAGRQQLLEQHKEFAAKFRLVRCGLDARWFDVPTCADQPGDDLVCVARLDPQKDPLLLLEAAAILVRRGVPLRLKIAGDGSLRKEMDAYMAEHGLGQHVVLLGWQTQQQVFEHLRAARALVLSSHDEGLPVAIMEAFALGVPAIAPDVGGVRELVETGVSGWLVQRGDVKALADAMHACLLAAPDELTRMGAEARRRIQPHDIRVSARTLAAEFTKEEGRCPCPV